MGKHLLLTLSIIFIVSSRLFAQVPPPPGPICSLQVVVHVLHQNGPENIADSQILDAIKVLNEDFSKTNADTVNIIPQFRAIAADSRIRFHLATLDPHGNHITGIDRIDTAITDSAGDYAKINQWSPEKYINIWVAKGLTPGVAGYAYLPDTIAVRGSQYDGIMFLHNYIGTNGTSLPSHAHVLTEEMGRYLGLLHPWGETNSQPAVACGDDGIADTPETQGFTSCPSDANQAKICHPKFQNGVSDSGVVENYQNFMDYSYCSCMFTEGQCFKMRQTLMDTVLHIRDQLCGAIGVGIDEMTLTNNEFSLYPNPATGSVQISYQLTSESAVKVELFDALGRIINIASETKEASGKHSQTIDTKTVPQGVYLVRLTAGNNSTSMRLVVVK